MKMTKDIIKKKKFSFSTISTENFGIR